MRLILFLLLLSGQPLLIAQESPSTTSEKEAKPVKETERVAGDKPVEIETPDTFDATEKLSEDVAAPFPVDI